MSMPCPPGVSRAAAIVLLALGSVRAEAGEPESSRVPWAEPERSHRVVLVVPRGERAAPDPGTQTFFLDLEEVGRRAGGAVVTESLRLVPRGRSEELPFSLDYRYGDRELADGEPVPQVTGYVGAKSPVADGQLRRLGYLSFRPAPRSTAFDLYFDVSGDRSALQERPNRVIRPWWIDVVEDSRFEVDGDRDGRPDLYAWKVRNGRETWGRAPRPGGTERQCLRLTHPGGGRLVSVDGLLRREPGIAGRRLVLYQQLFAASGLSGRSLGVSLPNAFREKGYAAHYPFGGVPAGSWYELAVEGRVRADWSASRYSLDFSYDGPCYVDEVHMQLPPELASTARIGIDTDVAQPGDTIGLFWESPDARYLYRARVDLESRDGDRCTVRGERVEGWDEGFRIHATVTATDGRRMAELHDVARRAARWKGQLRLGEMSPGRYRIALTVFSREDPGEVVARQETDLTVLPDPFASPE